MGSPFLIIERVAPERKKTLPPWPNTSSQPLSWPPTPSLMTVPTPLPRVGTQPQVQPMPPLLPRATGHQTPATELPLPNTLLTLTSSPTKATRLLPPQMVEISSICQRSSSCSRFSLPSLLPSLWLSSLPRFLVSSSELRSAFSEAFSAPSVPSRSTQSTPSLHRSASPCATLARQGHLHKPLEGVLHQDSTSIGTWWTTPQTSSTKPSRSTG